MFYIATAKGRYVKGLAMEKPVRKSPRISYYDYSKDNFYFVTICDHEKRCIFGFANQKNRFGKIAEEAVLEITRHSSSVRVDKFVVMPNHIHMILVIGCDNKDEKNPSLTQVIGLFKSGVTREIHKTAPGEKVWQRSFHDHIIRNQMDYERIWHYIDTKPVRWEKDCFYMEE